MMVGACLGVLVTVCIQHALSMGKLLSVPVTTETLQPHGVNAV
jgi:hypothetical protein